MQHHLPICPGKQPECCSLLYISLIFPCPHPINRFILGFSSPVAPETVPSLLLLPSLRLDTSRLENCLQPCSSPHWATGNPKWFLICPSGHVIPVLSTFHVVPVALWWSLTSLVCNVRAFLIWSLPAFLTSQLTSPSQSLVTSSMLQESILKSLKVFPDPPLQLGWVGFVFLCLPLSHSPLTQRLPYFIKNV